MSQHPDVRRTGERVEEILAGTDSTTAEELVRLLVELYGAALARVMELVDEPTRARLAADRLVESLLLVHDLHPDPVDARVQRALDQVRPYLGSHAGGVTYQGVDEAGVAHLTLSGNCHGCRSSASTVELTIEQAVRAAAPEVTAVTVAGVVPLLQIGPRPRSAPEEWVTVPPPGDATLQTLRLAGGPVLLCQVDGALYAYRDACPRCGSSLAAGWIDEDVLYCPGCAGGYHVRLAGTGRTDPDQHLEPLPLLMDDGGGARIAVGAGAA